MLERFKSFHWIIKERGNLLLHNHLKNQAHALNTCKLQNPNG